MKALLQGTQQLDTNMPKDQYRNPNEKKKENGYENRRGVDIIGDLFGGALGNAIREKRKHKERIEKPKS